MCLATYHRASYGEVDSYGYGRRGRYADYDEDVDESDFEEYDVSEEQVYAHAFVGLMEPKSTSKSSIWMKMICWRRFRWSMALDVSILFRRRLAMRGDQRPWYHRGAVIMCPRSENWSSWRKWMSTMASMS